jgi:hypothetical protein
MEARSRHNYREFKNLPPDGYEFTSRTLSEDGRKNLHGYWIQFINHQEKYEEIQNGDNTPTDWEWLGRYSFSMETCILKLKDKGFIKKIKKN